MIYVKINDFYININHVILIAPKDSSNSKLIYGFTDCREIVTVPGTPKEIIESIRKQIKEQICRTPELMEKIEDRFKLMDFDE